MITGQTIYKADFDEVETQRKPNVLRKTFEADIDGKIVLKHTMQLRRNGMAVGDEKKRYVCDGFYFANERQLAVYLQEWKLKEKKK